jgi:hypothetical protein
MGKIRSARFPRISAARQAAQRFAPTDAVVLCNRALELVPRLPPNRARNLLELEILSTMSSQIRSSSWAAASANREPVSLHSRAIEIARTLDDPSALYGALTQLCNFYLLTNQYKRSIELFTELEDLERAHKLDPSLLQRVCSRAGSRRRDGTPRVRAVARRRCRACARRST